MERATKIQKLAIPKILKGNDIIARAKTGSGKTAAFALPILAHLSEDPYGIFALILTPTRELACQVYFIFFFFYFLYFCMPQYEIANLRVFFLCLLCVFRRIFWFFLLHF